MYNWKRKIIVGGISLAVALGAFALMVCISSRNVDFDVSIASLTAHNTSASPDYNQEHFPQNFGTTTYISRTETMAVNPARMDVSMNAASPGHVSCVDVHTLIPSRPDLRWFAHFMSWWGTGTPCDIGIDVNTEEYVKSLISDLKRRGFDGIIMCWSGPGSRADQVTQKIQTYLKTLPEGEFTFTVLMDQGLINKETTVEDQKAVLEGAIRYCQKNYFSDPNYEKESGKPILMFYGVRVWFGNVAESDQIAADALSEVKDRVGGEMVWSDVRPSFLNEAWEDEYYDWHDGFRDGVNPDDPYNLQMIRYYYEVLAGSGKKGVAAMCAGYNGSLTRLDGSWANGGYLPQDNGACLIARAELIDSIIPNSVTRIQWVTWNDWAEGTAIEPGIDNGILVDAHVEGALLHWNISGGTGDERTIDHYEIYATEDGVHAACLGSVPVGTGQFNLLQSKELIIGKTYKLMVVAVGKPCIRNCFSGWTVYTVENSTP